MTLDPVNNVNKARGKGIITLLRHPFTHSHLFSKAPWPATYFLCICRTFKKAESQLEAYGSHCRNSKAPYQRGGGEGNEEGNSVSRINHMTFAYINSNCKIGFFKKTFLVGVGLFLEGKRMSWGKVRQRGN